MPSVAATATAFPPHRYPQEELLDALRSHWGGAFQNPARLEQVHRNTRVRGRHLALPLERYATLGGPGARNDAFLGAALPLCEELAATLCRRAGLSAADVGLLASTTVTGLAVPSLEARLMDRMGFGSATRRLPLFGLGCVAGAAGVARLADFLRGDPGGVAMLLAVELCSLTMLGEDHSMANVVGSGLFGDGAAGILMVGDDHPLARREVAWPAVVDSRSEFFPGTQRLMGWDFADDGMKLVLSPGVPAVAREGLRAPVEQLLAGHGLRIADIDHWLAHPGGPKVIEAVEEGLGLPPGALDRSRQCLEEVGNLSSASVLQVTDRWRAEARPRGGAHAVMLAMGPGFCAEVVLLRC